MRWKEEALDLDPGAYWRAATLEGDGGAVEAAARGGAGPAASARAAATWRGGGPRVRRDGSLGSASTERRRCAGKVALCGGRCAAAAVRGGAVECVGERRWSGGGKGEGAAALGVEEEKANG